VACELSIVVPAYNERLNLGRMVDVVARALPGTDWEVIFVDDDSPDGSYDELVELSKRNSKVRFVRRVGRRGLASACLEGMGISAAEFIAVMDADLQHDEMLLPSMLATLRNEPCDLVIGSRYHSHGGIDGWSSDRACLSRMGTQLSSWITKVPVSDPLSGFFMLRREVYESAVRQMSGTGFKILLDFLLSAPAPLRVRELPYVFRQRLHGESKLDVMVGLEYLTLLLEKTAGRFLPVSFVFYLLVGLSGLAFHLALLALMHVALSQQFWISQAVATAGAMCTNFVINNLATFRHRRLKGANLLPGIMLYAVICGFGAVANVEVADYLFEKSVPWWLAGVVGAGIGAVWNYAVSKQVVWGWAVQVLQRRKHREAPSMGAPVSSRGAL